MNRRGLIPLLVLLAILGGATGLALAPSHTPEGQPPLQTLGGGEDSAFRGEFNDAAGKVRVILLFSPT
jgi:hypothetical protein